jgi:hypothetical protein
MVVEAGGSQNPIPARDFGTLALLFDQLELGVNLPIGKSPLFQIRSVAILVVRPALLVRRELREPETETLVSPFRRRKIGDALFDFICRLRLCRKREGCVAKRFTELNQPTSSFEGLALQSESFPDELNLPKHIVFWQPPHLALPDHMQNLVSLNRSPGAIE